MDDRSESSIERAVETMVLGIESSGAPEDRRAYISVGLIDLLSSVTGIPTGDVPEEEPLTVDSLQATQIRAVLDAAFGLRVPLRSLVAGVSVPRMTDLLLAAAPEQAGARAPEGLPDPAASFEPFDLTDVQQAYLYGRDPGHELGDVDASFCVELATVGLDVDRFERAVRAAIARHDMLRAVVRDDGRQQVLPEVPDFTIVREDLSTLPATDRQERLEALRAEMSGKRRDVGRWPLFDLHYSRLDSRRGLLRFGMDLLICDGASFAVLIEELADRYADPERQWPAPGLTFRDYQQAVGGLEAARRDEARAYWTDRLDTLPPAPELPLAGPLAAIDSPRFHRRHHALSARCWRDFKDRAATRGLTPSTALAAAYADVLARWSRSADFTFNVTVNNRRPVHEEVKKVIGDFTTLTLLEVHAHAGRPFAERAMSLQTQLWEDLDHREYSGIRVMRELARRSGPAAAVSPVVFSTFVGSGFSDDFAPDWLSGIHHTLAQAPQLTLECLTLEHRGALHITWDSVDDAFAPGVLDDMFAAYRDLVQCLATDDGAWDRYDTVRLPARQLAERRAANETSAPVPRTLLHRLGTALARRGPEPAVITGDRTIGYGDLDRMACRIGRGLRRAGARPNQLVAVVMEKGWEQVVAVLAVLYSGAAYLPIDASLPADRIRRLLALGEADLVLTQSWLRDRVEWPPGVTVFDVSDPSRRGHETDAPLEDVQSATDLAYVIFTSGSTGEPKGVMIDHRGAANTTRDINTRFGIGPGDRVLALSSLGFDLSVWDVFGILAAGGALVVPEPEAGRDPHRWTELVTRHQVTVWNTVPALMQMYVTYAEAQPSLKALAPLRLVLMSGDWIEVTLADRVRAQKNGPVEIISLGGATEASIWSIHHPIGAPAPGWKSVPYGKPLANQTFHVLDDAMRPRPDWVTGKLFIGGIGLAHGYWRDRDRTAERFVLDPHTGERLYDTGDLGRYHPGGTIEFLGRDDGQVKVNGYRIELGEIEHTLTGHPAVQRAVAVAAGNRLLAFVTTSREAPEDPETSARAQVTDWQQVFDSLRTGSAARTAGWADSFTGKMISEEAMADWADVTVRRVLAHRPRRVLEIGCGTGLIASRLLPECAEYMGTDLSARTLEDLSRQLDRDGTAARAVLLHREATDFSGIPRRHFDCVVVNSVVQYFPSADYLLDTVRLALSTLRPGGMLYLGDVRDLRLLRPFHTAVERARSAPQDLVRDLGWRTRQRALTEDELVVDPRLFWAGLGCRAAVLPRPGRADTEMADYRYDVMIFNDSAAAPPFCVTLPWTDSPRALPELEGTLSRKTPSVRLSDVVNERLERDIAWAERLHDPAVAGLSLAEYGNTVWPETGALRCSAPSTLIGLADRHGYTCEFFHRPEAAPGTFDAVFTLSPHDTEAAVRAYTFALSDPPDASTTTNAPLLARQTAAVPARLIEHARQVLPAYMVPSDVFVLAGLPLTANGKVDVGLLRQTAAYDRGCPAPPIDAAPRDATERALATAWQEVLGVAGASVHDDFFKAGGDSLLAVRLVRAAGHEGVEVTVADVFAHPTIAHLADLVRHRAPATEAHPEPAEPPQVVMMPEDRYAPFPLTDLQQAYLLGRNGFFDLGNVAASFYVELAAGDLDPDRLSAAVEEMVRRHDMLRAVIGPDGQWHVQRDVPPYRVPVADLRHLGPAEAEAEVARIRRNCSEKIYDPGKCPLFDVRISRLDGSNRLHICLDLLIADGGTVAVFLTELAARYAQPERGRPELTLTFRDYHLAMTDTQGTPRHQRARDYWMARVPDLPPAPRLPLAADPADVTEPHFSRRTHRIHADAWSALRRNAARHGITPSAALATAYAETLAAWSDGHPFTLNVTVNKRLPVHEQVSEIIGDFTAVNLLAVAPDPAADFAERAKAVQTQLARDLDHSEFTGIGVLREIARLHGPARATMPVVFTSALDSAGADFGRAAGGLGTMVDGIVHTPQVHLDHQVFEYAGELVLNWDSVDELFHASDLDGMFRHYAGLVERLAAPESTWADVALGRVRPPALVADAAPAPAPPAPDTVPATPGNADAKRILARIWCEVLGVDTVDDTAEFTRLGGDSLLAMQVIARAADAGLVVSPREFFAHQTITALAVIARPTDTAPRPARDGEAGLLPRQLALLDEWDRPGRHNYVLLFDVTRPLDRTALKVAMRTLLRHHEALRLSFVAGESGWTGQVGAPDQVDTPLTWVDLTEAADDVAERTVKDVSLNLQSSIDIGAAPLWRVAVFQGARRRQLLLVVNQLICDNYSCRILCEDLLSAHGQVTATGEAALAPADSVRAWAELVRSRAEDPEVRSELAHWLRLHDDLRPVPLDESTSDEPALIALDPRASAALVDTSAVPDVLLAAIARAVARRTGDETVRVDLDSHGRDLPSDGLDPTRVIGRLATRWPLDVPALPGLPLHEAAAAAGEARRRAPATGNHYELLAAFCEPAIRTAPAPVLLNYLGHSDALWAPLGLSPSPGHPGLLPTRDPRNRRPEFLAGLVSGRLVVACTPGAEDLLHEIGNDITAGLLGHITTMALPAELDVLRHWLAH